MEEFLKVRFSDDAISDVANDVDPLDADKGIGARQAERRFLSMNSSISFLSIGIDGSG